jgi:carboxylesterase type B
MMGYWTQFAKTGDPNGPGLPPWQVYDPKTGLVQKIGHQVSSGRLLTWIASRYSSAA